MDHFNKYRKGKKFILYMDHKLLEKLGHLHSKTMNRFQTSLIEHNFIIQYKKGLDMPADYLSQFLATTVIRWSLLLTHFKMDSPNFIENIFHF